MKLKSLISLIFKYKMYFIVIIVCFFIVLGIVLNNKESVRIIGDVENKEEKTTYNIRLKGEVINPNIYYYEREMYLFELIDNAGGFTHYVYNEDINLIEKVNDDRDIIINKSSLYKEDVNINIIDYSSDSSFFYIYISSDFNIYKFNKGTLYKEIIWKLNINTDLINLDENDILDCDLFIDYNNKLLNINKASYEDLKNLNVLNSNVINNILKYIEDNGSIESFNELDEVSGVGTKTIDKLKGLICFK